jgi:hypothetical protein
MCCAPPDGSPHITPAVHAPTISAESARVTGHGETTGPIAVGNAFVKFFKVTDTHSTGIHIRNLGKVPLYVSMRVHCVDSNLCPPVSNVMIPPAPSEHNEGNDYVYTANTLGEVTFDWVVSVSKDQAHAVS